METLLIAKNQLVRIYARYESYILAIFKFILVLITMLLINADIGYMTRLKNPAIVLIMALLGSFIPMNATVIFIGIIVTAHIYELSLECAVVTLCVFVMMFIVYFRFSPADGAAVLLTPILFYLKIPYVVPVVLGLLGTPLSCVAAACGVVAYYVIDYAKVNADQLSNTVRSAESTLTGFKYVIDGMLKNETMFVMVLVFVVTTVLIFIISRLSIPFCWKIAMGIGSVAEFILILVGNSVFNAHVSVGFAVLGIIIGILIGLVIEFFAFNVDFARTEYVQFQDDDYYYYVKAVPKVTLGEPEHRVKRM